MPTSLANQPPPLEDFSPWGADPLLRGLAHRHGAGWIEEEADALGRTTMQRAWLQRAEAANRHLPALRTHDRFGERLDAVDYHPAYDELMSLALGSGLHSLAWRSDQRGRFVARAVLNYLWNQFENGTACPITMSFAAAPLLAHCQALTQQWRPKLVAAAYDPRPLPVDEKRAVTIGMAMTERQGGSDLRATQTEATALEGHYQLEGHKWFCSAPMSDGFFTLARLADGVTCFFVPRSLDDGRRNPFFLQRLKDKCGNRSNASAEVEFHGTHAWLVGQPGRGIATLLEMAHLTRFDITVACAGLMRSLFVQAFHHARHRRAFGLPLVEQPLMTNVLADLAIEWQAAAVFAFRLASALDAPGSEEKAFLRAAVPIAKYWLCKRLPMMAAEAMECSGGNGYVEEAPLARFYREAPLNGIWEGSGNVICLDVLRSLSRPGVAAAILEEIARGGRSMESEHAAMENLMARGLADEGGARRLVERLALALQASLLERHAPAAVAHAFRLSRLGDRNRQFGTLPPDVDVRVVLQSAWED